MHARIHMTVRAAGMLVLLAGLWLALLAPAAGAHALLIHASPAVNGTVARSPQELLLTFTEPVDPTLSHVQVVDTQGRPSPACRHPGPWPATHSNSGSP